MAWFWWLLFALIAVMWIAALVDIIRRRHAMSGGKLAAWLLIIIIFPILGPGIGLLAAVGSLVGGLFFLGFAPTAAVRQHRGVVETIRTNSGSAEE